MVRERIRAISRRARAVWAREPALVACFAAAYLCALAPIWWPRFLPLLDQPNHLASIAIWHRLGDPSWGYDKFYTLHRIPVPYWGYYFPVHALAYLFPVEIANKVYLSLYAAALPASVVALGRRFGRSPWCGLFAFPLVFNHCFSYGFISYCAGLPTLLFALALLDAWLERGGAWRLGAMLACTLATFFMHVLPWVVLGVCAVPVLAANYRRWRRGLAASAGLLATAAYAWVNFTHAAAESPLLVAGKRTFQGRYERMIDSASQLPHRVLAAWPGDGDEIALLALALGWILVAATARRTDEKPLALRDFVPEVCFAIAATAYLALPFQLKQPLDWWNVNPRLVVVAALFGALMLRGPIAGRRRWLLAPAVAAALLYPLALARHYKAFDGRMGGLVRLMEKVPRGSSTLALAFGSNGDPDADPELVPYIESHSYAQLLAGGYNPYQLNMGFPFKPIPRAERPAPTWNRPQDFTPRYARYYDYVLTHDEPFDGTVRLPLVARDGAWRLYRGGE